MPNLVGFLPTRGTLPMHDDDKWRSKNLEAPLQWMWEEESEPVLTRCSPKPWVQLPWSPISCTWSTGILAHYKVWSSTNFGHVRHNVFWMAFVRWFLVPYIEWHFRICIDLWNHIWYSKYQSLWVWPLRSMTLPVCSPCTVPQRSEFVSRLSWLIIRVIAWDARYRIFP